MATALTKPTGSSRVYNGASQTYALTNFKTDTMNISGSTSGTNIGSYTVTVSLKDTTNYTWADGTTSNLTLTWSITKRTQFIATPITQHKIPMGQPHIIYIGHYGEGTFSVSSSNTNIYSVTCTNYTNYSKVTITPKAVGTATLTLTKPAGTHDNALTQTVSLTVIENTNRNLSELNEGDCNLYYYTGEEQIVTIPPNYEVKLHCWGAAGCKGTKGAGGYVAGILPASKNERTLYLHVGGMGYNGMGGWNGGGGQVLYSGNTYGTTKDSGSGGGATDITIASSTFSVDNFRIIQTNDNYKSRLIVAGGGGGGYNAQTQVSSVGGYAPTSITAANAYAGSMQQAGTTTSNCSAAGGFGYGGTAKYNGDDYGGGGGGWYGGTSAGDAYAGGGSNFIWSDEMASYIPSGYSVPEEYKLTDIVYKSGSEIQPEPNDIPDIDNIAEQTGNLYNGFIKISVTKIIRAIPPTNPPVITVDNNKLYKPREMPEGIQNLRGININNITASAADVTNGKTFINSLGQVETGINADVDTGLATSYFNHTLTHYSSTTSTLRPGAFAYQSLLTTVDLPNVTDIASYAFYYCNSLSSVIITAATKIEQYAFYECNKLSSINLSLVKTIGSYAFYSCSILSSVGTLTNVTSINTQAFAYNSKITFLSMPKITSIANLSYMYGLKSVSAPKVSSIAGYGFYCCSSLAYVNLPSCHYLNTSAFANCYSLSTVSLSTNVSSSNYIAGSAFLKCYRLSKLYLRGSYVFALGNSNTFSSTPIGGYSTSINMFGSVYVPSSLLTSYKAATNWTYFSSRILSI